MMRVLVRVLMLSGFLCNVAGAAPLSATFDPALGFPEEQGFQRFSFLAEETVRSIEDGVYRLDSLASVGAELSYVSGLSMQPGERMLAEWTAETIANSPGTPVFPSDVGVAIGNINIWLTSGAVYAGPTGENPAQRAALSPGAHRYGFGSDDGSTFWFRVDGALVYSGMFETGGQFSSRFAFGDTIVGASSLSAWSGASIFVMQIPEPAALPVLVGVICSLRRQRPCAVPSQP